MSPVPLVSASGLAQHHLSSALTQLVGLEAKGPVPRREHSFGPKRESKTILDEPWFRIAMIFGLVFSCSLLVASIGCLLAHCNRKRKKAQPLTESTPWTNAPEIGLAHAITTCTEDSSEEDFEILARLDALMADQTMANKTFKGRELDEYRKEMKAKAKRQARGAMRTSQGINLPVHVRQLKSKMRSLIRSMTRSEAVLEPPREPASPESLDRPAKSTTSPGVQGVRPKITSEQTDSNEKSSAPLQLSVDSPVPAPPKSLQDTKRDSGQAATASETTASTIPAIRPPPPPLSSFTIDKDIAYAKATLKAS